MKQPCHQCGYDLRSAETDGVCPECGLSVEVTLRSGHFRDADPAWRMVIQFGLGFLIAAALVIMNASIDDTVRWWTWGTPFGALMGKISLSNWIPSSIFLAAAGAFFVTAKCPSGTREPPWTMRRVARGYAWMVVVITAVTIAVRVSVGWSPHWLAVVHGLILSVSFACVLLYVRSLTTRLEASSLGSQLVIIAAANVGGRILITVPIATEEFYFAGGGIDLWSWFQLILHAWLAGVLFVLLRAIRRAARDGAVGRDAP